MVFSHWLKKGWTNFCFSFRVVLYLLLFSKNFEKFTILRGLSHSKSFKFRKWLNGIFLSSRLYFFIPAEWHSLSKDFKTKLTFKRVSALKGKFFKNTSGGVFYFAIHWDRHISKKSNRRFYRTIFFGNNL